MRQLIAFVLGITMLQGCVSKGTVEMKAVISQGSQVRFRIPEHWKAEPDGNGNIYYDPEVKTGSLRLSVLTYRKEDESAKLWAQIERLAKKNDSIVETLTDNRKLVEYDVGLAHHWVVQTHVRDYAIVAIFTFAYLEPSTLDQDRKVIKVFDREIRDVKFLDQ